MKTKLISYFLATLLSTGVIIASPLTDKRNESQIMQNDFTIELMDVSPEFSLKDNGTIEMSSPFIATQNNNNEEMYGSFWAELKYDSNNNSDIIKINQWNTEDIRVAEKLEDSELDHLKKAIDNELKELYNEFSNNEIEAIKKTSSKAVSSHLNNNAPSIIYTNHPSSLIIINGEPIFEDLDKRYSKIINAGAFIIKDNKEGMLYMYGGGLWFKSTDALIGWKYISSAPNRITKVMRKHARELHKSMQNQEFQAVVVPEIIVSTQPAEIISTNGRPKFVLIQKTTLAYIENTDADVFKDLKANKYYTLFSGRWFVSNKLEGNWQYISSNDLPEVFAKIPDDHDKSNVLVSVAGTKAAQNAIKDAAIPYVQKKDISTTLDKQITYDGEPVFVNIEGTDLLYAANTNNTVIKWNENYYLVDDAVWYTANTPYGDWNIATIRPTGVEDIPADNPLYNIKYVYIYKKADNVVYTGFTSGYTGSYICGPTIVFGTGFHYHGWYGHHYYHYPMTYGYGFYYDPFYGWGPVYSPFYRPSFYWHWHWRYWYGYRPPYYRPPHHHPPRIEHYPGGNRPVHGVRPEQPIHRPGQPATLPSQPNVRPVEPNTRPGQPTTRPSQPSTRPSQPNVRPAQPSTRPSQPAVRPAQPSMRPSAPATRPSAPASRPSAPASRPSAAPSQMR